ncbi:MAG: trypsin-like peptidase domain-containing protein [Eubacteriales bacterium]
MFDDKNEMNHQNINQNGEGEQNTFSGGTFSGESGQNYYNHVDNQRQQTGNTYYDNQNQGGNTNHNSGIYHYSHSERDSFQGGPRRNTSGRPTNGGNGKKESSIWKKILGGTLAGLFFGLAAGVSFFAVNQIVNLEEEQVQETTADVLDIEEVLGDAVAESSTQSATLDTVTSTTVVTDVTEVVEAVMPSVVSITNTYMEVASYFGQSMESEVVSSGSGIIIGENETELLIVTNNHVIADANVLTVQFINGGEATASVKGVDSSMDLAVIAVNFDDLDTDTKESISIATLGDSDSLQVGEPAIAIGNALGYGQSVTTGVISAVNRSISMDETSDETTELIQTDAAINPGNSGGALLNMNGEVIGINSNKIGGTVIEGMGYAIPISAATPIIEELMVKETMVKVAEEGRGYLGITGVNVTSDVEAMYGIPTGAYVAQVYEGFAGANAGLSKGDIITAFEGEEVTCMEDLQGYLEYYAKGDVVEITIQEPVSGGYQEKTVTVTLGDSIASVVAEEQ